MMRTGIAVVGGGAAGLFAALYGCLVNSGRYRISTDSVMEPVEISLFESMPRAGRKIGLTGKGRCNLTNTKPWNEFQQHIHPKANFFKSAFHGCSNREVMEIFESLGLPLVVERGDRVYPASMRAVDVIDTLTDSVRRGGAKLLCGTPVGGVVRTGDDRYRFRLLDTRGDALAEAQCVIIATGGLSYPTTGSTGDGYLFAKGMGHSVTSLFPSLTALGPENYDSIWRDLGEETLHLKNVELQLLIEGNPVMQEFGDADFTDGGIEGPIGYKISRRAVEALTHGSKVEVVMDLKPAVSMEQLSARADLKNLRSILPAPLVKLFSSALKASGVSLSDSKSVASMLKGWRFRIAGYVGYRRAVVTAGGVSLKEISPKSMESKIVPGLYFAGEVLDMDCDTGGYNLQMAFSTGALAMRNAILSVNNL